MMTPSVQSNGWTGRSVRKQLQEIIKKEKQAIRPSDIVKGGRRTLSMAGEYSSGHYSRYIHSRRLRGYPDDLGESIVHGGLPSPRSSSEYSSSGEKVETASVTWAAQEARVSVHGRRPWSAALG
jgi:hypothetical protein